MGRHWTLGILVVAMLTVARPSWALLDWIWELSGPSMLGTGGYCSIELYDRDGGLCAEYGYFVAVKSRESVNNKLWLRTQSTILTSTWNNDTDKRINALTFTALAEYAWTDPGESMAYSGVGYSANVFFGSGFETYNNPALVAVPIGARFRLGELLLNAEVNLRRFQKTFNPVDVSNPLPESETTLGFTFMFIF